MSKSRIVVLGGAHIDRRGRLHDATMPGASNPGHWIEEPGGGAFNAARNLARLGHDVVLISPRGGDGQGEQVRQAALAAGVIDRPFTFLDRQTPSYTAILEHDGNLIIALADMELYSLFTPRRLSVRAVRDAMATADLLLTDANLPAETLLALAVKAGGLKIPLAGIAISPAKAIRFKPLLDRLACLFMNEAEAKALTGAAPETAGGWPDLLRAAGLSSAVVTRGRLGAVAYDVHKSALLAPPAVETLGDVTGAGDAMAAGFIDALLAGKPVEECLLAGTALATLTVRSPQATDENLTRSLLDEALGLVPAAEIPS